MSLPATYGPEESPREGQPGRSVETFCATWVGVIMSLCCCHPCALEEVRVMLLSKKKERKKEAAISQSTRTATERSGCDADNALS